MASITTTPAAPTTAEFCKFLVASQDSNDSGNYDNAEYPSEPEIRCYLTFELGGEILGKSYVFTTNADGEHLFNNYIFPEAGSWTVRLSNADTDASITTASVTVS